MKTFEVKESFILEAHNNACSDWKNRIEKEVPKLFKNRLEVGKWYIQNEKNIVCYQGKGREHYGFDKVLTWTNSYGNHTFDDFPNEVRQATKEEVETALIAEAKKRGFKEGVKTRCSGVGDIETIGDGFFIGGSMTELWVYGHECNTCIFKNGKWAEIIEEPTKEMTIEEIQEELGCKIKIVE